MRARSENRKQACNNRPRHGGDPNNRRLQEHTHPVDNHTTMSGRHKHNPCRNHSISRWSALRNTPQVHNAPAAGRHRRKLSTNTSHLGYIARIRHSASKGHANHARPEQFANRYIRACARTLLHRRRARTPRVQSTDRSLRDSVHVDGTRSLPRGEGR